ncbi:MAG: TIGR02996 domain-containing protein [Gemmataceae bacterium]
MQFLLSDFVSQACRDTQARLLPMNEREALLRAVCENPDDDTPRLVFADWLDEHDEPERAEFIRLQVAAALHPAGSSARLHKEHRPTAMLRTYEAEWRRELPTSTGYRWGDAFVRGFVPSLTVLDEAAVWQAPNYCFNSTPLTKLRVQCRMEWNRLFADGFLTRLPELTLETADIDSHAEQLCEIGPWSKLRRLTVIGTLTEGMQYVRANSGTLDRLQNVFANQVQLPPLGYGR